MSTKQEQEREQNFRRELQEFLARHNARLNITDDGKPYGMHSAICVVEMDGGNDFSAPYVEFVL